MEAVSEEGESNELFLRPCDPHWMELYFLRHPEWERLYNCSQIDVDSVPLARRQSHKVAAHVTIVLCAIFYFLYIPCMHSLWKHLKEDSPCTRTLFYMGVMDFGILWVLGFLHGILSLQGAVYCTHPMLLYFVGVSNNFFFSNEMLANLLLAVNRCLDMLAPSICQAIFGAWRIWLWLAAVTLYGSYWMIFVRPALFNSIYFAFFFNPFHGYIEDVNNEYPQLIHTIHDWLTTVLLTLIYFTFIIALKIKLSGSAGGVRINRLEFMAFLQVAIISVLHITSCLLYVLMQSEGLQLGENWIVLGQFAWFFIHGFSPVIFLTLNGTIRDDCIILFHRIFNPNRVRRIHGVTVVDPKVLPSGLTTNNTFSIAPNDAGIQPTPMAVNEES